MTSCLCLALLLSAQSSAAARPAGASISGTVVTDDSTPMPMRHAVVELNGPARQSAVTGDEGVFAFRNLAAGRYEITVDKLGVGRRAFSANLSSPAPTAIALAPGQQMSGLRVVLPRGAVIAGRITDIAGAPLGSATVTAIDLDPSPPSGPDVRSPASAQSDDDGNYRIFGLRPGRYAVRVLPPASGSRNSQMLSPVETYFQSAQLPRDADIVSVAAREERLGVDVSVKRALRVEVSGTVRDEAGQPVEGVVRLVPANAIGADRELASGARDGVFVFDGVSPGAYVIRATFKNAGADRTVTLSVVEPIEVSSRDQQGLTLIAHPPVILRGQTTVSPVDSAAERPRLALVHGDDIVFATIQADGSFAFTGLEPGTYSLNRVAAAESGGRPWLIESATIDGHDVSRQPIEIGASPTAALSVSLTPSFGGLRGRISNSAGAGAPELAIVVINADRKKWGSPAGQPVVVWPDTNGEWSIEALAAGNYFVAALGDVSLSQLAQAEFLEAVANASVTVGVKPGVVAVQDLKIRLPAHSAR